MQIAKLSGSASPGVVIESARIESDLGFGYSEYYASDCSIGETVVCDLDDADNRFVFDIVVELYVVEAGSYDVTWNFTTDGNGEQHTLLSRSIQFE